MSEIPPSTPPGNMTPPVDPVSAVSTPAIMLMVVGGIGAALQVVGLLINLLGAGANAVAGGEGRGMAMMSGGIGIMFNIIGICVAGLIIFGALKMKKLESYNLAMTASIVAMIPCISPCCLIGLPIGIWALVVLLKPEVKAAFH